jgi:hypothetical protein
MEPITNLRCVYQFPGFDARATVSVHPTDPEGLVIALRRRKKRPSAEAAVLSSLRGMIVARDESAICPVATGGYS